MQHVSVGGGAGDEQLSRDVPMNDAPDPAAPTFPSIDVHLLEKLGKESKRFLM
jgi:hypothetical protein